MRIGRMPANGGLFAAYPDWTPESRIVSNTYDLGLFQATMQAANSDMGYSDRGAG